MKRLLPIFLFLVAACGTPKFKTVPAVVQQTPTVPMVQQPAPVEPLAARPAVYRESRTKHFELIHTRLDVRFDWENSLMFGKAAITLSPTFYPQSSLVLDAKGMLIHKINIGNQLFNYEYNGEQLTIQLDKTYRKSDTLTLSVEYTAQPDLRPQGGSEAIAGDKGLYFINPKGENPSKMPQIWTQGETESNSVWFPTIDAPNQKMTQDLFITVDRKYATLSNGVLVKSTLIDNNLRTDHWQQTLPHAPYLTMMGIGEFAIVKDQWKRSDGKVIPVHYYVEPQWKDEAKAIFGRTPLMIGYFSKITGFEYPWDKYHQIVVRDYVSGAMENTGAVIFGEFVYSTPGDLLDQNWDDIVAHELSHHWFGDLVTCESWSNLPLNESFATYFEVLWDEHANGKQQGAYHLQSDRETYFRTAENGQPHHDLIWFDYDDKEQMFDGHSYSKGACILHMLRSHLGDEAFFASIKHYLHQHRYGTVEAHDLRLAFEAITGVDLNWFFNQWFFAKGHPKLKVDYKIQDDLVLVEIEQLQDLQEFPLYRIHTNIRLNYKSSFQDFPILLREQKQTFAFSLSDSLRNFQVDPDHNLLAEWQYQKPKEFWKHQCENDSHYVSRKRALSELANRDANQFATLILNALQDEFFDVRLEAIEQCNRIKNSHEKQIQERLVQMISQDPDARVRAAALKFMFDIYPESAAWLSLANQVLEKDQSSACRSWALYVLGTKDAGKALQHAATWENEKSSILRTSLCQLYSDLGDSSKFEYFKKTMRSSFLHGNDRMSALFHFGNYISRFTLVAMHAEALSLMQQFVNPSGYEPMVFEFMLGQIQTKMTQKLKSLNEEIQAYENAKDFVWAQRLKKERDSVIEILALYSGR